LHDLQLGSSDL